MDSSIYHSLTIILTMHFTTILILNDFFNQKRLSKTNFPSTNLSFAFQGHREPILPRNGPKINAFSCQGDYELVITSNVIVILRTPQNLSKLDVSRTSDVPQRQWLVAGSDNCHQQGVAETKGVASVAVWVHKGVQ